MSSVVGGLHPHKTVDVLNKGDFVKHDSIRHEICRSSTQEIYCLSFTENKRLRSKHYVIQLTVC